MHDLFIGLDIETSGTSIKKKHRTIQLGAYYIDPIGDQVGQCFKSDITWGGTKSLQCEIDPEALKINGYTKDQIMGLSPTVVDVDLKFKDWLISIGCDNQHKRAIGIGWNVASFDLQFIQNDLPISSDYLSYRSVDLNAICFTLDGKEGVNGPQKFDTWKKQAKSYAKDQLKILGYNEAWHDAFYDAAASYYAWIFLKHAITINKANIKEVQEWMKRYAVLNMWPS